uniref:uncharacterized protein LOC118530132 isoform X5 n=1 Tax=Halichoerus grypus TaxID=9711 RepID=UPI00165A0DA4|nr:uncharacterized protein LOC118530132 isoform X5 [Halichoerus grypus]
MSTSVWPSLIQIRSSSLAPGVSQPFATSDPPGTNPRAHACALRTFPKLEAVANAKTILGSEAVQKRGSHCCNSRVLTKGTGAGGEVPVLCPRRRGFTETPAALTAGPLLRGCPGRPAGPHPRRADTPSRQSGGRPDHGPDFPTDSRPTESNPDPASSPTTHLLPPWEITSGCDIVLTKLSRMSRKINIAHHLLGGHHHVVKGHVENEDALLLNIQRTQHQEA